MQHLEDLAVWRRAQSLAVTAYLATSTFPPEERFGLTAQIRRAAVSVPTNIAEGHGRGTDGEFRRFLSIAMGSLLELESELHLAAELGYLSRDCQRELQARCRQLELMLYRLRRRLKR